MHASRWLLGLALLGQAMVAGAAPPEVAVLSTLHKLHAEVPAYDNAALAAALVRLQPDVLCIEVGPEAWAARRPEGVKVEYPLVVYPLIDRYRWPVCLLEPADAQAREITRPYIAANQAFHRDRPGAGEAFNGYMDAMYALLKHHWQTPSAVNDPVTDAVLAAKHQLQDALVGADERRVWEAWNQQFLERIVEAAAQHPGKRIVVLAGAEHGYWLRARLAGREDLRLLDTPALLAE